jgi:hypothetical protein
MKRTLIIVALLAILPALALSKQKLSLTVPNISSETSASPSSTIKVLSLAYFPIKNGQLDTTIANNSWNEYNYTLGQIRDRVNRLNTDVVNTLTDGTKYKGFRDPNVQPHLHYEIVQSIEKLEALPASAKNHPFTPNVKVTDYTTILKDIDICHQVDAEGVREIWLWGYTGHHRTGFESNFQSRWGDISNSDRDPSDMPPCAHSYTVYEYNYGRDVSEATEDHMHQFEAIFNFVDRDLFWNKFVGYFPGGSWSTASRVSQNRRCGWAHFPPNGEKDYDWTNPATQTTDCENWSPDGYGQTTEINCTRWKCNSKDYFIWWMQNIPGASHNLTYQEKRLRNWWDFIADFDDAMEHSPSLTYAK